MSPESDFAICPACAGSVEHGANIAGWRANGEAIFHSVCHPNYDASDRESGFPERSRNDDATIQQRVEAHREKREERYGVDRNDGRDPLRQRVAGKGSEPSLKNSRPATDAVPSDDPATAGESGEEVHDGGTAPHAIPESEFARDDEFKALQKAHQRLKGRYKKLERTVTLKDQIIKTREFEISELRKGLR